MRTGLCYFKTAETVLICTFSYICFKVIECSTVSVCVWVFRMSKIKIYLLEMFSQVAWDRHSVYHKFLVVRWCWKLLIVNNWTSCCTWDLLQCSKQYLYNIIFPPAPHTKNKKASMKKDCDQQHKGPFGLNDSISATIFMLRTSCWVWWILWCSLWMKRFYLWLCCFFFFILMVGINDVYSLRTLPFILLYFCRKAFISSLVTLCKKHGYLKS